MDWPKQNTGLFAVPLCVQCCTYAPPDKYETRTLKATQYLMVGTTSFDGSNSGKLYLTVTWNGQMQVSSYNDGDCTELVSVSSVSYAGSSTRNLNDFVSATGTLTETVDGVVVSEQDAVTPFIPPPPVINSAGIVNSQTETTETWTGLSACLGGYLYMEKVTGTATATLTDVCTEEVAIAYQESLGLDVWSWTSMDEFADFAAISTFVPSAPGVEGAYDRVRLWFRRTKGGFTPGAQYVCTMEAYRATAGTYDFALYATLEETLTADAQGTLTWEDETPFARGYSTWVKARSFTATLA